MNSCTRCGLAHGAGRPCPVGSGLPARPDAPLAPGTVVGGRFRVEAVAHRSGMSTVYQAADQRNQGSTVALKELCVGGLAAGERAEALAWLAREAALLSTLSNPRLPRLLAAFSEGDRHYVAMPFLAGETLEERVRREGAQAETAVLAWGRELVGLLRYLHGQEPPVVHRDLKPANVLLRPDGSLALLDLGVAREVRRGTAGTAVGTPGYAPPEQYQGLADERSDLYALGATLHRALTGYDPEGEAPFRQPGVRALRPEVSEETAALVAGLLQVAPGRRPGSAGAVLGGIGVAMRGAFARAYRPVHQMYWQVLALLAVAVVLSGLLYRACYGLPLVGGAAGEFKQFDPVGDPLRVGLVFLPGLLSFLPLLRPSLRALARRNAAPRLHRNRVAKLLLLAWGLPLAIWLVNLYNQHSGNLVAVPGHAPAPAGLALGAIAVAFLGLIALYQDLRRLQVRVVRLRWRYLVVAGVLALWPVSLAMQAPAFQGSCYMALTQAESQTQFTQIRALATDSQNNLYILDQNGLRERTADNTYHTRLDSYAYDATSPVYTTLGALQHLAIGQDDRPILGTDDGTLYRLAASGKMEQVARIATAKQQATPTAYTGLAVGPKGSLFYSVPPAHQVYMIAPRQTPVAIRVVSRPVNWQPAGLAADTAGNLYVADPSQHAIEEITRDGHLHTLAGLARFGAGSLEPWALSRDSMGNLYTVANDTVIVLKRMRGGHQFVPSLSGDTTFGPSGFSSSIAAGFGSNGSSTVYAVSNDAPQPLLVEHGMNGFSPLGGADAAAMHCDLPRTEAATPDPASVTSGND